MANRDSGADEEVRNTKTETITTHGGAKTGMQSGARGAVSSAETKDTSISGSDAAAEEGGEMKILGNVEEEQTPESTLGGDQQQQTSHDSSAPEEDEDERAELQEGQVGDGRTLKEKDARLMDYEPGGEDEVPLF